MINKTGLLFVASLGFNTLLSSVFAYKYYHNWFENEVLKEPFRTSIFQELTDEPNKIYFVGDSHTEAFELAEILNNPSVRNRGIWGDKTTGIIKRLDRIIKSKPRKIFIMVGVNDICAGTSVEEISAHIELITKKIKSESPATELYIQSVLPTNQKILHSDELTISQIKELNERYSQISKENGATFINLFPYFQEGNGLKAEYSFDGLHLNGKGYMAWKKLIMPYI
ncbi:GDSL-type esterase/lipase family protein [Hymenobacter tibetensis]|uniref:GDSL-type esterase/lipase family protein n=1 Tax=Hymenobacter tibetensis TaxID=497967 RepID=A0ABY4CWI4_9BACT|nr:GDSL-type esterase/lipase family protein [Hymenobacter tibetensis]UOG74629.1 GDSL-type esterase/lipase family protein [Hymenobacter tibetensis]